MLQKDEIVFSMEQKPQLWVISGMTKQTLRFGEEEECASNRITFYSHSPKRSVKDAVQEGDLDNIQVEIDRPEKSEKKARDGEDSCVVNIRLLCLRVGVFTLPNISLSGVSQVRRTFASLFLSFLC